MCRLEGPGQLQIYAAVERFNLMELLNQIRVWMGSNKDGDIKVHPCQ